MAQEQDITFITEDIPGATSFIQSGRSLRLSYAARQEAKYINEAIMANIAVPGSAIDPTTIDAKTWESMRAGWKKDAEVKYPEEGDYKVWIIDPNTGLPAPLGEVVEFIGGDVRETPGGGSCKEYTLDLSGAGIVDPLTTNVYVTYEDCFLKTQNISDTAANLSGLEICVGRGTPTTNLGVFVEGALCDLTYKACMEYFWNLEALGPTDPVTIDYIDCDGAPVSISTTAGSALSNYCGEKDSFVVSAGTLVLSQTCTGGIPETYL